MKHRDQIIWLQTIEYFMKWRTRLIYFDRRNDSQKWQYGNWLEWIEIAIEIEIQCHHIRSMEIQCGRQNGETFLNETRRIHQHEKATFWSKIGLLLQNEQGPVKKIVNFGLWIVDCALWKRTFRGSKDRFAFQCTIKVANENKFDSTGDFIQNVVSCWKQIPLKLCTGMGWDFSDCDIAGLWNYSNQSEQWTLTNAECTMNN
jgi:hypothetical protein